MGIRPVTTSRWAASGLAASGRTGRRLRRGLATGLVAALAVGLAAAPAGAQQAAPDPDWAAGPDPQPPVLDTAPVPARAGVPDRTAQRSLSGPREVAWPAPGVAEVALPAAGGQAARARAGDLPVAVGPAGRAAPDARMRVEVHDRETARAAGVTGLVFTVTPEDPRPAAVTLAIDYGRFRYGYGGGWQQRLRLVRLPDCAGCVPATVPSTNDSPAGRLTAEVTVGAAGSRFALTSEEQGAAGDYTASPLSATAGWEVSTNDGSFRWNYPMPVPEVPGGLVPDVALGYSSASVDGRTLSTNAQPSVVGEGWAGTSPGFIERAYRGCADDDATPRTGDLCWFDENASISFGERSSELVRVGNTRTWRLEADDGTRVRQLFGAGNGDVRGEYWEVTTTDGVRYRFGSRPAAESTWTVPVFGDGPGSGCGGSFDTSDCVRAWRWNLDSVVDPRGNTMSYQYARESNRYDRNLNRGERTAAYTRGGYLEQIDYGARTGGSGPAPARVVFGMAARCLGSSCSLSDPETYPDTPLDLRCTSRTDCDGTASPTFWTTKRLATVTTQVRHGGGYRDVDRWRLSHLFADPQEEAPESLWLHRIVHTARAGDGDPVTAPAVTFPLGQARPNRADPGDGDPRLYKYRIDTINNGTGGQVNISYADPDCDPADLPEPHANGTRCFPMTWALPGTEPREAFFHTYVVSAVLDDDLVGGSDAPAVTTYHYHGRAAWRYQDREIIPEDRRTWSEFRGYQRVEVRQGSGDDGPALSTEYRYFRGMDGDRARPGGGTRDVRVANSIGERTDDLDQYAGFLLEETVRNGVGGPAVSTTLHDPWHRGPTATRGRLRAYQVEVGTTRTRTPLASGEWRTNEVDYTYLEEGLVERIHEQPDGLPAQCTTIEYARNESTWLLDRPSRETVATTCAADPPSERLISRTSTFYDGSEVRGAPPTRGEATRVREQQWQPGGPSGLHTVAETTYDAYGRVTSETGAGGHTTTTAYTDADGRTASTVVTNPLGHAVTTTMDPWRGEPTRIVDANGRTTDLRYDAAGRLTAVWLPGRSRSLDPDHRFAYRIRDGAPSWVSTRRLTAAGNYRTSYQLLDGFLRERQSQTPVAGPDGGRVVEDTFHDSRGLVAREYHGYVVPGTPGPDLVGVDGNDVHRQTWYEYDGAGREVERIRAGAGRQELWRTSTGYQGERVHVTPPPGGTATTTVTDARDRTVELREYHGPEPDGPAEVTRYGYTPAGHLASITDPTGENTWEYTYDLRGRRIRSVDPDTGTTTMTYDRAGDLLTRTDGSGSTVAYEYDPLGRRVAAYRDSADGSLLAEWHFDTLAGGGSGALGEPAGATRHHEGHAYEYTVDGYDAAGRVTGRTVTIPAVPGAEALAGSYTTGFSYAPDGSPRMVRLPGAPGGDLPAEALIHDYDQRGMPASLRGVSDNGVHWYVADTGYQPTGEPGVFTLDRLGSGVSVAFGYDLSTRRLTSSRVLNDVGGTTREVEHYRYRYDPAGNVTRIADLPVDGAADVQCFDYDQRKRLTAAWTPASGDCGSDPSSGAVGGPAGYWTSYGYDQAGNRTRETWHATTAGGADTERTYQYPAPGHRRPHALQQVATTGPGGPRADSYAYDGAGRTVTRNRDGVTQHLTWDAEGRVAEVATPDGTTSFVYDADGERLVRREPGATTVYLGDQELRLAHDAGEVTGTRYYRHAGHTVAVRVGDRLSWLAGDQHQTDTAAVDATAGDTARRRFDPFGNPRGEAVAWPGERGFVGGTTDPGLDLVHLGAREYDPETGRFLSVDPLLDLSDPGQMHGYAYANHNPASLADPTGLAACGGAAAVDGQWCPSPKDGSFDVPDTGGSGSSPSEPRHGRVDSNPYPSGNPTPRYAAQLRQQREAQQRVLRFQLLDGGKFDAYSKPPVRPDCSEVGYGPGGYHLCQDAMERYERALGKWEGTWEPQGVSGNCLAVGFGTFTTDSLQLCALNDDLGTAYSFSVGTGTGPAVGVGVEWSPLIDEQAATAEDLEGFSHYRRTGGRLPIPLDASLTYSHDWETGEQTSAFPTPGVGIGWGFSAVEVGQTRTWVWR